MNILKPQFKNGVCMVQENNFSLEEWRETAKNWKEEAQLMKKQRDSYKWLSVFQCLMLVTNLILQIWDCL